MELEVAFDHLANDWLIIDDEHIPAPRFVQARAEYLKSICRRFSRRSHRARCARLLGQDDDCVGSDSDRAAVRQPISPTRLRARIIARGVGKVSIIAGPVAVEPHAPRAAAWEPDVISRESPV